MAELSTITNGMTRSLLIRPVYCICNPKRDGLDHLQGELALVRKKFFEGKKKRVRVGKAERQPAFAGKINGKMTRHGLYWKKTSAKLLLEEAFDQPNGYVVVKKDFRGAPISRTYFDTDHFWLKSEYFEPWEPTHARLIFKPQATSELVEQLTWDAEHARYHAVELYPLPYQSGTAEQSVVTARFGEPPLIVAAQDGEFCYCPKEELEQRKRAGEEMKDGTILLMPAWEVKNGTLPGEEKRDEEPVVTFSDLEEYAQITPPEAEKLSQPEQQLRAPKLSTDTVEFSLAEPEPSGASPLEDDAILQAAYRAEQAPAQPNAVLSKQPVPGLVEAYRGGYADGKREGFGAYYYKDGSLCYAGGWKSDRKEGLGVSFRNEDHALHISNWKDGIPGEYVTLFDSAGNLRYSGKMEQGKKQGAGVTRNSVDGTVFVGKWENGRPTGLGSSFDSDGNLLYYGNWKNGLRDGHGTEFDPSGGIVYDGEWKEGKYHNGILYQKLSSNTEESVDVFESTEL